MSELSFSSVPLFLERVKYSLEFFPIEVHFAFMFEPLPIVHLGISKL